MTIDHVVGHRAAHRIPICMSGYRPSSSNAWPKQFRRNSARHGYAKPSRIDYVSISASAPALI